MTNHRLPLAAGLAATVAAGIAAPASAATAVAKVATKTKTAASTGTRFTGPSVDTRWGPVQVAIDVNAGRIVDVKVPVFPNHKRRSASINAQALPWLHDEALQAQSAKIQNVSGATYTWEGYTGSLQGAIDAAHAKGAL